MQKFFSGFGFVKSESVVSYSQEKNMDKTKLTDYKWINLYSTPMGNGDYYFCSRRSEDKVCKEGVVDAVRALPYVVREGKIYVVVNKQFRYALGRELFELCAGLVENGEDCKSAIVRELAEEIGGKVVELEEVFGGHNSPGMSDEFTRCFIVRVVLDGTQNLDDNEQISIELVALNDIPKLAQSDDFCLQSKSMLMMFYYMMKYKNKQ